MGWHDYENFASGEDDYDEEDANNWQSLIEAAEASWDREDAMIEQGAARTNEQRTYF